MNSVYLQIMCISLGAALGLVGAAMFLRRRLGRVMLIPLVAGLLALVPAGYAAWFNFLRRPPAPLAEGQLHPGLTYERVVNYHADGAPYVAHVARWKIGYKDLRLNVVARESAVHALNRQKISATRSSDLLRSSGGFFLINGDFFGPWKDNGPWDYQPHAGDACETAGSTWIDRECVIPPNAADFKSPEAYAARGIWSLQGREPYEFSIHDSERGASTAPAPDFAISGRALLWEGAPAAPGAVSKGYLHQRHARSLVALTRDGSTMIFITIDGRQPGYSAGMSFDETARFALSQGAWTAMMLDGGGSATMVVREPRSGKVRVLNCPLHNTIPGRERPIANALVIE